MSPYDFLDVKLAGDVPYRDVSDLLADLRRLREELDAAGLWRSSAHLSAAIDAAVRERDPHGRPV